MSAPVRMRVSFEVTPGRLALAMAIDAHDSDRNRVGESFQTAHVEAMTKEAALNALREALWTYGALSWPDDYESSVYQFALTKARLWLPEAKAGTS